MNELKSLYLQNPSINKIDMSNKKINDSHNFFRELEKFLQLVELDLSGNEITRLPENMSNLSSLQVLDITNNPLENFDQVSSCLASLPKLIDLKINLSTQNEALAILNSLQNLEFLNGKSTKDEEVHIVDIEEKEIENISIDKEELEKFNKIFQKISEKLKSVSKESDKKFQDNYQIILKTEIEKINKCIENAVPNYIYASEILASKIKIGNYFAEKFIEYLDKKDPESSSIINDVFDNNSQSSDFLHGIIEKLYPKITEKTNNLKNQVEIALRETNTVDNAIQSLEDKVKQTLREKDFIVKQHQDERQILLEKIQRLEEENKMMTDKILKKTKDLINDSMIQNTMKKNENDNSTYGNNMQTYGEAHLKTKTGNSTIIGPTGARVLTKKMMKDVIEEIYDSKTNFDKKCLEAKLPRETMEQHMYTFLNQKYGLKNLIIEWASSIINGIKMYSGDDNDICVFGKILRNECEEEFRIVLQKVKNTIMDLLTFYLKGKFPLKSNSDIKEIVSQKNNGLLQEEEWKEIIFYMYEQEDANYLYTKIVEHIKRKYIDNKTIDNNKKMTREEIINLSRTKDEFKIPFPDFQKIILDFQLKSHDKYLRNFVYLFKRVDLDNNGIINEEEFLNMLQSINIYKDDFNEQATRLLNIIDPYNKQYITFSETISLFSMEFIMEDDDQGNKRKLSILERISLDDSILNSN